MARVVHFEIHAGDPPRAIRFYSTLFNWEFTHWAGPQDYWLIRTGPPTEPGIDGGLLSRRGPAPDDGQPVNAYVCTVQVADLDALLARAAGLGAALAVAKMPIPGVGWLAYVKDTEGNIVGMMQPDPGAA
jgi:predicted enzyme related to lactoylglutathione lyase